MVMAQDGVEDVILLSYGYPTDPARKPSLDYSRQLTPTQCRKTDKPRCHFVDPVQQLMGKITFDGIHPTAEGYDILGRMVWDLMRAEGMRR
jgi:lysophospholipase L1-like esterase